MTIILGDTVSCDVLSSGGIRVESLHAHSAEFGAVQVNGTQLATVSTSGDYHDLENVPTVEDAVVEDSPSLVTSGAVHTAITDVITSNASVYAPLHNPTFTGTVAAPVMHATTVQLNGSDVQQQLDSKQTAGAAINVGTNPVRCGALGVGASETSSGRITATGKIVGLLIGATDACSLYRLAGTNHAVWQRDTQSSNRWHVRLTTRSLTPDANNARNCGSSGNRWDNVYTYSVIGTSDGTLKQQVEPLTLTEVQCAASLATCFRTFRWNSSVASKGDGARTHTGCVAQEVEQVLRQHGLDPRKYAFWVEEVWFERDGECGDSLEDFVPGTAPCCHTRYAIRYDELLSFICAGFEARLASLEAHITS
jgi:hypothetical protein